MTSTIYTKLTVGGIQYAPDTLKVFKTIGTNNSAGTFEIVFRNENGYLHNAFSVGQEVLIYIDQDVNPAVTKKFGGLIGDITFQGDNPNIEMITLRGSDYTAYLSNVTVKPVVYNNTEISVIVKAIMSNNVAGITTTNVKTTTTVLNNISFIHTPVFDALKQLAQVPDYLFYVDENKDLHFEPKGTTVVPTILDNSNVIKSQFRQVDTELVNKVWVYGNRILTNWEQRFTANGGSVYTLLYNPANTKVLVGGSTTPKMGAVYNFTVNSLGSPTQYVVDYNNKNIIFVSGAGTIGNNVPISGTDSIIINYDRSVPIVRYGQDDTSIALYTAKEKVIIDTSITDPNQARDRLFVELRDGSSPVIQGTATVQSFIAVTPGNKIMVNLPWNRIDSQLYDVIEVNYDLSPVSVKNGIVTVLKLNKRILDITDIIKNLALSVRKLQAESTFNTNLVTRTQFVTGSVGPGVYSWQVKTRGIGNAFVLGHATNGKLGSPMVATNGSQLLLGSGAMTAYTINGSGGLWT